MRNNLLTLITLLILSSCNQNKQSEISIISNGTSWVGYKDIYFQKDLIVCGANSESTIILTEKINENDTIYSGINNSDNRFTYATRPKIAGAFKIKGKIITDRIETTFNQEVIILPRMEVVGFNTKQASDIKVGIENEIEIIIGVPKKYRTLSTDNGKIIERNDKIIIIPERVGACRIKLDVKMPSDEKLEFNDVLFNVTE